MISKKNIQDILKKYDLKNITIGVLGGHSALDVCSGAKKHGFRTVAICQNGRDKTYSKYYKSRKDDEAPYGERGCVDEIILVDKFSDIVKPDVQKKLRDLNTIFIHSRYFWVYFKDFSDIEDRFEVPIFGLREGVKLEERDVKKNQYYLLEKAGIRMPKILRGGDSKMTEEELKKVFDQHFVKEKGGPLIVKANEAIRGYERAFFVITSESDYFATGNEMVDNGKITSEGLKKAVIEEFIIGAQINFNFFYSPLTEELEIMGTDMRRQTSLDGFLRLDASTQAKLIESGYCPTMIEMGHVACTTKESILEKAFTAGEKFVKTLKKEVSPGIIGPFALQGAIASYEGREEFVVFDVSMRIPGSPGTRFTPCTTYLYGEPVSYGERIAMELLKGVKSGRLIDLLT